MKVVSIATLFILCCHQAGASEQEAKGSELSFPKNEKDVPTLDKNQDGLVSRGEAGDVSALARQFSSLDNNGDQSLDFKELSQFEGSDLR
jgi:hypothetical protein